MDTESSFRRGRAGMSPSQLQRSPWLRADWLDAEREQMELGPGGDVDANGRLTRTGRTYAPGLKRTVSIWLRLYERVQRGELGGRLDGQCGRSSLEQADGRAICIERAAAPQNVAARRGSEAH